MNLYHEVHEGNGPYMLMVHGMLDTSERTENKERVLTPGLMVRSTPANSGRVSSMVRVHTGGRMDLRIRANSGKTYNRAMGLLSVSTEKDIQANGRKANSMGKAV